MPGKLASRLRLALSDPREALQRAAANRELRRERRAPPATIEPVAWEELLDGLETALARPLRPHLEEPELADVAAHVEREAARLESDGSPFPAGFGAGARLARLAYALCRARRPAVVVETGVASGASSAHVLAALRRNEAGALHSIDWPLNSGDERWIGAAIPGELRARHKLHLGPSRRVLPRVLASLPAVDVFIHDSLHTFATISRELNTATPRLAPGAVALVDDADRNAAFERWAAAARPRLHAACAGEDGAGAFGVAVAE